MLFGVTNYFQIIFKKMSKKLEKEVEITKEMFEEFLIKNLREIESQQRELEDTMTEYVTQYRDYRRAEIRNVIHYFVGTDGVPYYTKLRRSKIGFNNNGKR